MVCFAKPVKFVGEISVGYWNVVYANGGMARTTYRCLFDRNSLRMPLNVYSHYGLLEDQQQTRLDVPYSDGIPWLCLMASKYAYENVDVTRNYVQQVLEMNFVEHYDFWNEYLNANSTHAFILTDKNQNADKIIVAFRGTVLSDWYDWLTDFDFSFYKMPGLGRVHVGFLEALGLVNRGSESSLHRCKMNFRKKKSKSTDGESSTIDELLTGISNPNDKTFAYDKLRERIGEMIRQNPNAKWYITGHSLGGALALLFTSLIFFEESELKASFGGVVTFGQPRVGDAEFCNFMKEKLPQGTYIRVVHRTDWVPRLPPDNHMIEFKHVAPCYFYKDSTKMEVVNEEPYKNLMSASIQPMPHIGALKELLQSLVMYFKGTNKETMYGLQYRILAVIAPGICGHFLMYYTDALRNVPIT